MTAATAEPASSTHRNEVFLIGELTTVPEERTLSDGRDAVMFRLDVRVLADEGARRDSIDISLFGARARKAALTWDVGDTVEVEGVVRRKFYKAGNASRPFTVVEADRGKRVRRG